MVKENTIWKNKFSFREEYQDREVCDALHLAFERHGYVKLPNLLTESTVAILRNEVLNLSAVALAREFVMSGFETPRVMTTVGGKQITQHSTLLRRFYDDSKLREILSRIVGTTL